MKTQIQTRENDEWISLDPGFNKVDLDKWEDEKWTGATLNAGWIESEIDKRSGATPYYLFPTKVGEFSVYMECNGFQVAKHNPNNEWLGFIGYSNTQQNWRISEYSGCQISNLKSAGRLIPGWKDVKVNGCDVSDQAIEADLACSFHLSVKADGHWRMIGPTVQRNDHYNFVVSYGGWDWREMEFGVVSVSVDEVNDSGSGNIRGTYKNLKTDKNPVDRNTVDREIKSLTIVSGGQEAPIKSNPVRSDETLLNPTFYVGRQEPPLSNPVDHDIVKLSREEEQLYSDSELLAPPDSFVDVLPTREQIASKTPQRVSDDVRSRFSFGGGLKEKEKATKFSGRLTFKR